MKAIWRNLNGSNSAAVLLEVTAKVATNHMSSSVQQLIEGDDLQAISVIRSAAIRSKLRLKSIRSKRCKTIRS